MIFCTHLILLFIYLYEIIRRSLKMFEIVFERIEINFIKSEYCYKIFSKNILFNIIILISNLNKKLCYFYYHNKLKSEFFLSENLLKFSI